MKVSTTGLKWHKLDLHVHTPASKDYTGDKKIMPEAFVQAVLSQDLDGIAVTDHNTAAWIDLLNAAARGTDLTIFPGVEVSVTGGKSGIHIIAIFDVGTSAKTIEALLSKLDINPDDYGKTEIVSRYSPQNAINLICELGGLAVLPHADSAKGVLYDMRGQARAQVLNNPALAAVEVKKVAKHVQLLDGTDKHYRRKLAVYRASDNPNDVLGTGHTIENVGLRYSWFKMDGISLEALRQCFHDPEVRIITDELFSGAPQSDYPRIMQVKITQGFLGGCVFDFHEGLNSVIGGKGVGKSMLVELIRFGLNQPSPIESVKDDMESKLEEQLGLGAYSAAK